jgi:hypothetical protein
MITINEAKKTIHFIPNTTDDEHPPERHFPLLSAYVCPFCRKILAAYIQGYLSEADIAYYEKARPRYVFGSVAGGHYLTIENHRGYASEATRCVWEVFTKRGVVENLRVFAKQHEFPLMLVQPLAERLHTLPCFCVVKDVCGRDKEMLLFSEDNLLGDIKEKEGFEAYWRARENMGEYLRRLLNALG